MLTSTNTIRVDDPVGSGDTDAAQTQLRNMTDRRVLLLTGVSGAGKSSVASLVTEQMGWKSVSEDLAWDHTGYAMDRGDPLHGEGLRKHQTVRDIVKEWAKAHLQDGNNVVVDFLMYQDPPLPLFEYERVFKELGVQVEVIILRPSLEVVYDRDEKRGRGELSNREAMAYQHHCYCSPALDRYRIVDTSNLNLEATFDLAIRPALEAEQR